MYRTSKLDARNAILLRVAELLGLRFATNLYEQLRSGDASLFDFENPFDETDLKEMREKIRPMAILSHSQGFLLRMKGVMSKDPKECKRLLTLSAKAFKEAITVSPSNRVSLRNYGDVLSFLQRDEEADVIYRQCLAFAPNDTNTLYKYGLYHFKIYY